MRHDKEEDVSVSVEWKTKNEGKGTEGRGCMEMEIDRIMALYFYEKVDIDIHSLC